MWFSLLTSDYHYAYDFANRNCSQMIGFVGDDVGGEGAMRGIFCVTPVLVGDAGPHIGSRTNYEPGYLFGLSLVEWPI